MLRRSCPAPHTPVKHPQCNTLFQSRCTIAGKVCKFIIDSRSIENIIATYAVQKLQLKDEAHPHPYHLAWLQQNNEVRVTRRALVTFSIGDAYHDQLYFDVVPMDACHLLLGRPWDFDRKVTHDGYLNTYTLRFNDRNFTLKPTTPQLQPPPETPLLLMQKSPFKAAMRHEGHVNCSYQLLHRRSQNNTFSQNLCPSYKNSQMFSLMIYHLGCLHFVIFNIRLTLSRTQHSQIDHIIE